MVLPPSLAADLNDPNRRIAAILMIRQRQLVAALPRLFDLLADDDDGVRWAAADALGYFQQPEVIPALIPACADPNKWVRAAAVRSLGRLAAGEAMPALLERLYDPEPAVRIAAVRALTILADPAAIPALTALLADSAYDWAGSGERVRDVAAQAIAIIRQRAEVPPLVPPVPTKSATQEIVPVTGVVVEPERSPVDRTTEAAAVRVGEDEAADEPVTEDEEMPDWLQVDAAGPPSAADLPDWLKALDTDEALDWLGDSFAAAAPEAEPPPAPASPPPQAVPVPAAPPTPHPLSEVNFSAYYPHAVQPERRYGLYVYAHLPDVADAVQQDAAQFRAALGGQLPPPKLARQPARLEAGTPVTVMLECDDLEFEPVALTKRWKPDWVRYDFAFTAPARLAGDTLFARVSVMVGGLEITAIKCPIDITPAPVMQANANPLAAARLSHTTAKLYQRIFVSYSRRDQEVAETYRLAQMALGNDVFMDSYSIRVGEDWRAALARAIDEADTFQLFWSPNAAESENVRHEWDYALRYRCPDTRCESFIRPVYWNQPMPAPPSELAHLHFRYVPFTTAPVIDD
ncbi:MAG: HEAT repeat domain-containing protein [Chloroflexi bacterium]|nr:HEAT repeat domain-containing protein [Chloroflexota bacterium]